MLQFSDYRSREEHTPNEHLYMRGLLLQLLYYLYLEGGVDGGSGAAGAGRSRQLQKVREILQYVESHYRENIVQADVAANFYFTPQYFSRLFKNCTGMTFTEHLMRYRLEKAAQELMNSDRLISRIARDNGFSDDRSFISAFKRVYGTTPLQYKKVHMMRLSQKEDK